MTKNQPEIDTFLHKKKDSAAVQVIKKVDFFSFVPFPKAEQVSTSRSLCGSLLVVLIVLVYLGFKVWGFVTSNPPTLQAHEENAPDNNIYHLPRFAIAFMSGQYLNNTDFYEEYLNFSAQSIEARQSEELKTQIPFDINDLQYLNWLGENQTDFYSILRSPKEDLSLKGLLYSSPSTNYTKITIKMCNVNDPNNTCQSIENIEKFLAGGRIFLFVEELPDSLSAYQAQQYPKYRLYNFFLMPSLYKRIILNFDVAKNRLQSDWFYRFSPATETKLYLSSVMEQISNTSLNAYVHDEVPLELLNIRMQLSGRVHNVKATYVTSLDMLANWWGFVGVVITLIGICALSHNHDIFYERYPEWKKYQRGLSQPI